MEPITTAAIIGAGVSAAGQGANALATSGMNRKTIAYNKEMYERQKADSLANWELQNSYNSPQAQMARLQAAGLNPNLVYGNGATATSGSAPDTPNAQPYKPNTPQFDLPEVFDNYFDVKMKNQALSNQKMQGDILGLDALLRTQDLRSKTNTNDFMETLGFGNRDKKEKSQIDLLNESIQQKFLHNLFMGGDGSSSNSNIHPGSGYDLQQKGLELTNQLRRSELQGKGYRNETDKIKSQFTKRTMSGQFKDMSAKDIMTLLIQGIGLTKR